MHPTSFALPPAGCTRVAPHTRQAMVVVARLKMTTSLPQSRQDTFRKPLFISITSLIDEFETLGALTWSIMRFSSFGTAEQDIDALGWFFPTFWFRTRESSVSCSNSAKSSLTPLQFRSTALLDSLDGMLGMLTSRGRISHNFAWHLDHCTAPQRLTTTRPPMTRI